MSRALLPYAGLRWWSENEIKYRNHAVDTLDMWIRNSLLNINRAWTFHRIEAPMIIPRSMIAPGYTDDDLWNLKASLGGEDTAMRPETTSGSYAWARHMLAQNKKLLPMSVWQVGKSYRRETNDGASASKLRFYEFTQAEWQCLYSVGTMADYREAVLEPLSKCLANLCGAESRIIPSDRLPDYSEKTDDVEIDRLVDGKTRWTEVASISTRTDFSDDIRVLEIAVGADRVVDIAKENGMIC